MKNNFRITPPQFRVPNSPVPKNLFAFIRRDA